MNFDPLDFNRKLFSEWEKKLAEFLDKRMRDPDFMSVVGKGIATTMDAKSAFDQRMEEWLKTLQLPTKTDLEKIWVTLNALETRVIDMEDRIEALEDRLGDSSSTTSSVPALPAAKPSKALPRRKSK